MQLTKCDRLRRFMKKHPEVVKMSYAEYVAYPRAPEIIDRDFYRIRKEFEEAAQEVVQTSGRKLDQIVARFKAKMKVGGVEAVEAYDYETFVAEAKVKVTREWFQRLQRRFVAEQEREEAPSPVSPHTVIKQKLEEVKALLANFGYTNIRFTADKVEHITFE